MFRTTNTGWRAEVVRRHPPGRKHAASADTTDTAIRYVAMAALVPVAAYSAVAIVGAKAEPSTCDNV